MNNNVTLEKNTVDKKQKTHNGLHIAGLVGAGLSFISMIAVIVLKTCFNVEIPSLVIDLQFLLLDVIIAMNFVACFLCKKARALHIVLTSVLEVCSLGATIHYLAGFIKAFIELGLI